VLYVSSFFRPPSPHGIRVEEVSVVEEPVTDFPLVLTAAASECKTVARDLWTRGWDRWMVRRCPTISPFDENDLFLLPQIIPTVRTTYDLPTYTHPQLLQLSSLLVPSASTLSLSASAPSTPLTPLSERIDWSSLTPPSTVVCFEWARGWHIDVEWWRATLEAPFGGAVKTVEGWVRRR
jgi:hypothetical protein